VILSSDSGALMSKFQRLILSSVWQKMFYAVAKGHQVGVYNSWAECQSQINGFSGPKFRKFPTKDEALAFINDFGAGSVGTKTQAFTPTKKGFGKQEPGFGTQEPGLGKQEPGIGKQEPGFVSRDNSLKREVLSLKACVQGMRKKFDDFVEQQKIAFEDIESRTDMIILAIEGTPSGLDSSEKGSPPPKKPRKAILLEELPDNTNIQLAKNEKGLFVDESGFIHVYTDGACSKNGQLGAIAGYGIWWAKDHELNQSERADRQTNNAAEIQAVTETIKLAKHHDMKALLIHTDSNFLIDCVTKWMKNWKKNGWKTVKNEPVKNREELEALDRAINMSPSLNIKYKHVPGHCGIQGNEEADKLAVMGAQK